MTRSAFFPSKPGRAAVTAGRLLGVLALGVLGFGSSMLLPAWIGPNFGTVVPGRVYRSGQLEPDELEERIVREGLRTILNLRGEKVDREWYRSEVAMARRHGVVLRSLDLIPERLPSQPDVVALIDYLETAPEPILIHCSAGSDRTGFASVVAKMAKGGASLAEARSELSLRYGHVPFGPSTEIVRIFDLYEDYLGQSGRSDRWEQFEHWARRVYVPYVYSARIEPLALPGKAFAGERMDVGLRVTNTSPGPWVLGSGQGDGIKLGVRLRRRARPSEGNWLDYDRHSLPGTRLGPGESLVLVTPIWAPDQPGEYLLKLDLVDEHVTWFEEQGSEPVVRVLRVDRVPASSSSSEANPPS